MKYDFAGHDMLHQGACYTKALVALRIWPSGTLPVVLYEGSRCIEDMLYKGCPTVREKDEPFVPPAVRRSLYYPVPDRTSQNLRPCFTEPSSVHDTQRPEFVTCDLRGSQGSVSLT